MAARDARFDGVFFVGVVTTGIYCRPVCPARLPARERCLYFSHAAEAERAGYRACFRCRPELAPHNSVLEAGSRLLHAALASIQAGYLNEHSVDDLSARLGVSARHLRRVMAGDLGLTPIQLAQTQRLALAKQLLADSSLTVSEVALAAGYASLRRFNTVFRDRFGKPPTAIRRMYGAGQTAEQIVLRLDFRPPFEWLALLEFLKLRAIPGVEAVSGAEYRRTVALGAYRGWLSVSLDPAKHAVRVGVSHSLLPKLAQIASRIRALLDLDARPDLIVGCLRQDALLQPLVDAVPGLRVPGAFDGFELAIRAVLGQQVTLRAATTLCGRVAARYGESCTDAGHGLARYFPSPAALVVPATQLAGAGLPLKRAQAVVSLAAAFAQDEIDLSGASTPEQAIAQLQSLPGIGAWTAQYIALRALRWPDAFPAGDLVLGKVLGLKSAKAVEQRAQVWQPWRAYAALHLWRASAIGGLK